MMAEDEITGETSPEFYKVEGFVYFTDENMSKYDFRTKSLDTAMDIMVALVNRPAHKHSSVSISLTIGLVNFSGEAVGAKGAEMTIAQCLSLANWEIQG